MNGGGFPWWWLLVASVIVSEVLAFWLGYYWYRYRCAKQAKPAVDAEVLETQITAFDSALQGIDHSLSSVDQAMENIRKADETSADEPDQQLHDQALRIAERLAAQGASKNELVRVCEITPGEAAMVHRLHKPSSKIA